MNRAKGLLSERVSIWSISPNWGAIYYILFSAQTTAALCLISWQEIVVRDKDTPTETLIAIGQASAPLILTIAAETLVIILAMEAITMLAERYLKKRYEVGKEEGEEIGIAKGREIGRVEGRVEGREEGAKQERKRIEERIRIHNARIDAWDERRLRAQADGKPFDEPMPRLGDA